MSDEVKKQDETEKPEAPKQKLAVDAGKPPEVQRDPSRPARSGGARTGGARSGTKGG